jgi:starch synthase
VENYDNGNAEHGTGFVFEWEEPDAVLGTLRWALDTYKFRIDAFRRMQQRGMMMDFSWDKSTKQYIAMYKRAISRH